MIETGARTAACDVLTFTADGKHLLAAGDDKVVRSWAVASDGAISKDARPTFRWPIFRELRGNIYTFALSPDQSKVVVAGHGQLSGGFSVATIDCITGTILSGAGNPKGTPQQGTIWASAFSPSGKRIAVGTVTGAVWIWNPTNEAFLQVGQHEVTSGNDPERKASLAIDLTVRGVAFDGEDHVISVSATGEMARWSIDDPRRKNVLHSAAGSITTPVVFSPDRQWAATVIEGTVNREYVVEVLSFPKPTTTRTLRFGKLDEIPHRVAFSSDGRFLAIGFRRVGQPALDAEVGFFQERDGFVRIFDLTKDNPVVDAVEGPRQGLYAEGLAFHPKNSNWLAVAGGDNHEVELWDWKANKKLGEVTQPGRCLWSVVISPNGNQIAFQDHRDHTPSHPNQRGTGPWRGFDLATRRFTEKLSFEPSPPATRSPSGWTVRTSTPGEIPSATQWYAVSPKGTVYPLPWSRLLNEFPRCFTFVPGTPERLIVGHYWGATVFDLTDDGPVRSRVLRGHEGYVTGLSLTGDGKNLVSSSRDMTISGWSLQDWPYHARLGAELFVRGGRLMVGKIASGSPLWEMGLETGDEILSFQVPDKSIPGKVQAKVIYDRLQANPTGTPEETIRYLAKNVHPGEEHLFYWKSAADDKKYVGLTSVVDRPLWRFFPHGAREWVLWQWRDYYYDCSTQGDFSIGWQRSYPITDQRKPDFFRAEQLRQEFLKPDKLKDTLSDWKSDQALVRFNTIEPPDIQLTDPKLNGENYQLRLTITPKGTLQTQQPARVLVWVNDYLLHDSTDVTDSRIISIPTTVLRHGENVVTAQCYGRGGARRDSEAKFITREGTPASRTLHAVLIGVSDYRASKPRQIQLTASEDAKVMARALEAQSDRDLFNQVNVKTILDREADRTNILAGLDRLRDQVKPDDLLIFHLGGHGTSLPELRRKRVPEDKLVGLGRFLFLCPNFDLDHMPDTTISFEELTTRINRLPCHKLLLLDACHSGEAETAGGDTDANPVRILMQHGIGPVILAACGPDQQAIENDALDPLGGGHGLFTIALRRLFEESDVFATADKNKDGFLESVELSNGVRVQLAALVAEHNTLLKSAGLKRTDEQNAIVVEPDREERVRVAAK